MKNILYLGSLLFLFSCNNLCDKDNRAGESKELLQIKESDDNEDRMRKACEYAYFEGQKDALNKNIRIKFIEEANKYVWIKSPWDSGREPLFIPTEKNN